MLKTALLSGAAAIVIAVDWMRFEEPRSGGGRPSLVAVIAVAAVLLRPLWLRLTAIAVSALLASWIAFSLPPWAVWPGGEGFFGPLGSRFSRGFLDFYDYRLPIDPATHPQMHAVILIAIFGFTLAVALAVAARRALLAVVLFFLGAGWPATLLSGGNELGRGLAILAVALALLAGMTERPSRLALIAAGAVLGGALALSSSPAVAKSAFLDWQHWDFYTRPQKAVSVHYVWDANYGGVRFPKTKTTVLTIRAPHRSYYWRATVLDRFDGTRWLEHVWPETARQRLELTPASARKRSNLLRQEVTVAALRDDHVIGASLPIFNDLHTAAAYEGQGVARVIGGLRRDEHYAVWSYAPRPTPEELVRVAPSYPKALTRPGRELDLAPGVTAPPFGTPGRDARLLKPLTGRLLPYAALYERAEQVAGQTSSPYAAVVALETWFRSTGGFTYSEQPGPTPGLPPLVGFVADTKTGYCQHFAGAMALMLRLLGIPARVAAGFLPGSYHGDFWQVTDHDAHTWVEVWFRGFGWLPFDPTPGRGHLSGTYSSTSLGFNAAGAAKLLAGLVKGGEVFGSGGTARIAHLQRRNPRSGDLPLGIGSPVTAQPKKGTPSLLFFLFLLAAGVAAAIVLLKLGRRKARYLTRDPRRIAVACARELAEYLHDQRLPSAAAVTFRELGGTVRERLGVDASSFAQAATAARYGPPEGARQAAGSARKELRELKRHLRRSLARSDRARGLLSVRSLGLG
ncbi:MAG TPA: transglutaminaseTgpA domain-containing protein [Gaiellaceae bacterium]